MDPLCGTLNYATGSHLVAVNVALRDGPAAVADPFSGEVFLTDGVTAWVRCDADADGDTQGQTGVRDRRVADGHASGPVARRRPVGEERLAPTADTRLVDVNLDPPFPGAPAFRAVDLLAHPGFVEHFRPRVVSTTLALAWVAVGRRAAYVTDGGDLSGSVHFAAGIALCRAMRLRRHRCRRRSGRAGGPWPRRGRGRRNARAAAVVDPRSRAECLRHSAARAAPRSPQTCSSGGKSVHRSSAGRWPVSLNRRRAGGLRERNG